MQNNSIRDLENFVQYIKKLNLKVFFLSGEMGSGKTTFVKKYCEGYPVTSPTYTIHNEITNDISHFDLYRCSQIPFELFTALVHKQVFIEWWEKWPFQTYKNYLLHKDYCFITMGKEIQLKF